MEYIFIRLDTGISKQVDINLNRSVKDLRQELLKQYHPELTLEEYKRILYLFFNAKILKDNFNLNYYGIQQGSTIWEVRRG
jgi:hypothetical protein